MAEERRTILYSGRVQGVGFRWRALMALKGMELTGYVQNLPDGRVELVLEGAREIIDSATSRIRESLAAHIRAERQSASTPTGEFDGLGIRP